MFFVRVFFSILLSCFGRKSPNEKFISTSGQAFEFRRRRKANDGDDDDAGKTHTKKLAYRRNKKHRRENSSFYSRCMQRNMGMVWRRASPLCWIYYSVCCLLACWTFAVGTKRPPLPQRIHIHWCNFTMELSLSVCCRPTLFQWLMSQIEIVSSSVSFFRRFFFWFSFSRQLKMTLFKSFEFRTRIFYPDFHNAQGNEGIAHV